MGDLDFLSGKIMHDFFYVIAKWDFFAKIFKKCADKKYLTFLEASVVATFLRSSALLAVE